MRVTQEQLASTVASMKQTRCEIEKMLNEGFKGVEAMKACGEKLGG
jgi:DNA-binding XRE family transcriptional regulator